MGSWARTCAALAATLAVAAGSGAAGAACPDDGAVGALAGAVMSASPTEPLPVETMADGYCAQDKLVALLRTLWGDPIGYKAGLTSAAAQALFGVGEPVRGVLLRDMMRENGATLAADFGAMPRYEADLVVVVGDAAVNEAKTPAEVLVHLSAVQPFIELPDLTVTDPRSLTGPAIAAINVGARFGVLGDAIPVETTPEFLAALADMTITVADQDGRELVRVPGTAVLGHPLNAVLWLRDSGVRFRAGDIISVGSFGPLLKPAPGLTATVTYTGLPGNPSVSVTFR